MVFESERVSFVLLAYEASGGKIECVEVMRENKL